MVAELSAVPRLDQLAAEGLRLTNFNMEVQCTPSRSAIMTGRYVIRSGNGTVPLGEGVYGLVQIDSYVGELLDTIDELGIAEETIFIFTADIGPESLSHGETGKFVSRNRQGGTVYCANTRCPVSTISSMILKSATTRRRSRRPIRNGRSGTQNTQETRSPSNLV